VSGAALRGARSRRSAGGTVAYVRGAGEVTLDHPIDRVGAAATHAVQDLKFALVSSKVDAVSGESIVRTARDLKIEVGLTKAGDHATNVDIRVGVFGDQAVSPQVLEQFKSRL
jgi:hypothetical protein